MADYDVIVIGAGNGGLSAGCILAAQKRKVLVLEQSDLVGGCCSTFEREGFHFDIGASIVETLPVIGLPFQECGSALDKEMEMVACDPIYEVAFTDGDKIAFPLDAKKTAENIRRYSAADADSYPKFLDLFRGFIEKGGEAFFTTPVNGFLDLLKLGSKRPIMLKYLPMFLNSYEDVIRKYFKHDKVLQSVAYQSYYIGHAPDLTPGLLSVIPATEHTGIYYPKGGMIQIGEGMRRCGERHGMEIRFRQRVTKVLIRDRRVAGVRLADGTEITCKALVSDINAKVLYLELIGEEHLGRLARSGIKNIDYAMSCPMMYLGVDYQPPVGAHHTIFPLSLEEMNDYSWNGYNKGKLPKRQFGLICCPTLTDPNLAPQGQHVINVTLAGPYHLVEGGWDTVKDRLRDEVIELLDRHYLPDLKKHIKVVAMTTPLDFERRLLNPKGAIYGLQQDVFGLSVFRPSAKSRSVKGLYLAGASTHPGGGVPLTIGSGYIAAKLIEKYEP